MIYSKYFTIILISILTLSSANYVNGEENTPCTIYVSKLGNDTNDGLTPETSKKTIQNALKVVRSNGTVYIAPGTYKGNIVIKKNVQLIGTNPQNTIIKGKSSMAYINCIKIKKNCRVLLQGLTITYGDGMWGGGIYNEGELTIHNCVITNNKAKFGAGIYNYYTKLYIEDTIITKGVSCRGGGIYNDNGIVTLKNTNITQNEGQNGNDANVEDGYGSTPGFGGGIYNEKGTIFLFNSSITYNTAEYVGGLYSHNGFLKFDDNSIISNNKGSRCPDILVE